MPGPYNHFVMSKLYESEDKPLLEVYPWYFVGSMCLLWTGVWFALWSFLRGMVASLVVYFSSVQMPLWVPWLLPTQFVVWLVSLYSIQHRLRNDRNPSPIAVALTLILLVTWPRTCFLMMDEYSRLTAFELQRRGISSMLQLVIDQRLPETTALVLAIILSAIGNRLALRVKFRDRLPRNMSYVIMGWSLAVVCGILTWWRIGLPVGLATLAFAGNAITVREYREKIREEIQDASVLKT